MNIKLFKNSWTKFYKRAFITTFFITTFITLVDQGLSNPIFASKITSIKLLIDALSYEKKENLACCTMNA